MGSFTNAFDPNTVGDASAAPVPQADPAELQSAATGSVAQATQAPSQPAPAPAPAPAPSGSRLGAIVQAVAKVASTALSGVPDRGRPSFVTGLGEGARSEQATQANLQAIKFKTFDDQVRAAQLHNQDLELQQHTQAQQDAHQVAQNAQHDWDEAHGLQYTEIPNSGDAATQYLTAQSGNGGASIPAGTHLSADGKTILIPKQSDETQTAQLQKYNAFSEAYGLPQLPNNAQFVPSKYTDYLQNKLEGHNLDGSVIGHDQLPGAIADLQSTYDRMKSATNADPTVLNQVKGTIGSMQAKLTYLDNHKAGVMQTDAAATAAGKVAGETSPTAIAGQAKLKGAEANAEVPSKIAVDQAKSAGKPVYAVNSQGQTVLTTTEAAASAGMQAVRPVTQTQISGDVHNNSVMEDVTRKLNAIGDTAKALDQGTVQRSIINAALTDDELKVGAHAAGAGFEVPTQFFTNYAKTNNQVQATPLTKAYINNVIQGRETIGGLNKVLTGGVPREFQSRLLQATMPGFEDSSATALQKLAGVGGNVDALRGSVPVIPGTPRTVLKYTQQ